MDCYVVEEVDWSGVKVEENHRLIYIIYIIVPINSESNITVGYFENFNAEKKPELRNLVNLSFLWTIIPLLPSSSSSSSPLLQLDRSLSKMPTTQPTTN